MNFAQIDNRYVLHFATVFPPSVIFQRKIAFIFFATDGSWAICCLIASNIISHGRAGVLSEPCQIRKNMLTPSASRISNLPIPLEYFLSRLSSCTMIDPEYYYLLILSRYLGCMKVHICSWQAHLSCFCYLQRREIPQPLIRRWTIEWPVHYLCRKDKAINNGSSKLFWFVMK